MLLPSSLAEPAQPTLHLSSENDAWLPHVDLYEGPDAFEVLVDVPSLAPSDLHISRSGSHTRVRGGRSPPYNAGGPGGAVELRGERLYGTFQIALRVPDQYEKRWSTGELGNGVLRLRYRTDEDAPAAPSTPST